MIEVKALLAALLFLHGPGTGTGYLSIANASYANVAVWEYDGCKHHNPRVFDLPKHSAVMFIPEPPCGRLDTAVEIENGGFSEEWCEFRYNAGVIKEMFYGADTVCASSFGAFVYNL